MLWMRTQLTLSSLWSMGKQCSLTMHVFGLQAAVKGTCFLLYILLESVDIARYMFGVCGHCQIHVRSLVTLPDTRSESGDAARFICFWLHSLGVFSLYSQCTMLRISHQFIWCGCMPQGNNTQWTLSENVCMLSDSHVVDTYLFC